MPQHRRRPFPHRSRGGEAGGCTHRRMRTHLYPICACTAAAHRPDAYPAVREGLMNAAELGEALGWRVASGVFRGRGRGQNGVAMKEPRTWGMVVVYAAG